MRFCLIIVTGAASVLPWPGPAGAGSHDARQPHAGAPAAICENAKLRAADRYFSCLIHALQTDAREHEAWDDPIDRCDERFDRAFARAEADGACHTPGGPSTMRQPLKAGVQTLADNLTAETSCANLSITPGEVATCSVNKTTSAIDLAAVVGQLAEYGASDDTTIWIEAWGGDGGQGNTSNGGPGGAGGYAQTTTSVNDLVAAYGSSEFYYYLGLNGTFAANSGGDGGSATLATVNDLTAARATLDETLLLGGGGGGGGGGRGTTSACGNGSDKLVVLGGAGGAGGVTIANTGAFTSGAGDKGGARRDRNVSGEGGVNGKGGFGYVLSVAYAGDDGQAALGGRGGNHQTPQVGFVNQSGVQITASGGEGVEPGDDAGGGGGGGGYGAGGGGDSGKGSNDCVSGGGGGGASLAVRSTRSCPAAPQTRPDNPNGIEGFVQITFDLGVCE